MKKEIPVIISPLLEKLLVHSKRVYESRLVTLAIFGSWAGGRYSSESDIDILVVAKDLARKRLARVREFEKIENKVEEDIKHLAKQGVHTFLSPVFKTPEEVRLGSPLFLDMLYDLIVLYDENSFFLNFQREMKKNLKKLGAKRIMKGERWYWVLKPDYKPGETFEI